MRQVLLQMDAVEFGELFTVINNQCFVPVLRITGETLIIVMIRMGSVCAARGDALVVSSCKTSRKMDNDGVCPGQRPESICCAV